MGVTKLTSKLDSSKSLLCRSGTQSSPTLDAARGRLFAIYPEKLETAEALGKAIDYKVDVHIKLIRTKDPVKRKKLLATYNMADKVCIRLLNKLSLLTW